MSKYVEPAILPGSPGDVVGWNCRRTRTGPEVATWLASASEYAKMLGQ